MHSTTASPFASTTMDEYEEYQDSLRTLAVEPQRRALGLDKMFLRAGRWRGYVPSAPLRPPSPPAGDVPLALPLPLRRGRVVGGEAGLHSGPSWRYLGHNDGHEHEHQHGDEGGEDAAGPSTRRYPDPDPDSDLEADPNSLVSPLSGIFLYPELVPLVLEQLARPAELAAAARVCRHWGAIVRRRLYGDVWVRPWEDRPKYRLVGLFDTLRSNPDLCALVRSLDIRFFPLDVQGEQRVALEDAILESLTRMHKLERLVWTRDRSLTAPLFEAITSLPVLSSLELSGHSTHLFDPTLLAQMPALHDLRVMMPDATFRTALPDVVRALDERRGGGLRGLALVSKTSTLINDTLLLALAPHLKHLRRLTLIGHSRVTREGVYALMSAAKDLEELVLDAPPHSDLVDLSDAPAVDALKVFSLSFAPDLHSPAAGMGVLPTHHSPGSHPPSTSLSTDDLDVPVLSGTLLRAIDMPQLPASDLSALELTLSAPRGGGGPRILSPSALAALTSQTDFGVLRRLALLNLVVDGPVLASILAQCPTLEELYISIADARTLAHPAAFRALGHSALRILHANAPEATGPTRADLAAVARMATLLHQAGSLNRVYEVHRRYEGERRVVELTRWRRTFTPGYFRVWRP